MIWRILGTIGAASFFVAGFTVLSDPNCITADIGGGRVVGVTCRADNYGAFSGGSAGLIMVLIGIALLSFIYWGEIQRFLGGSTKTRQLATTTEHRPSRESSIRTTSIKTCDKCGKEMDTKWGHCPVCLGTTFTHKQRELKPFEYSPREVGDDTFSPDSSVSQIANPEFKTCPMCAEEIKFAAKKCRYCQHMLDA